MKLGEAFSAIESELTALEMKNVWGEIESGHAVCAVVAKFHGARWDHAEDGLQSGLLSVDGYYREISQMIEDYARYRRRNRAERKLIDLRLDQAELDLCTQEEK